MTELRLQPIADWPLVLAVVVVLIALLWVRPRHVVLSPAKLATLVGLRLAVVLLTLLAMLRPMLVYTDEKPVQASLVMLLDGSRSMQVEDSLGDASRWQSMKMLLESASDDLAKLDEMWDLKAYQFDAHMQRLGFHTGRLDLPDEPLGDQTAIGAAIHEALEREADGRVLAMLLMSDGAQRAVSPRDLPPQVAVRRLAAENVPLYTFTFGKPGGSERADLAISDLVTNETIFAEAPTEVRGLLTSEGYANQQVKVQLLWEKDGQMEPVDTLQVNTGVDGTPLPVVLRHTPRSPGEYKVTLWVEPREGELVTTNNEVSTFVTVRTGGIKVLYLVGAKRIGGGTGGNEQTFARRALAQSPDMLIERRLVNYQPMNLDLRDQVRDGNYDVVILDDVDSQALTTRTWQAMADRVRDGMGLMMVGGYHSFGPGGFRDNPLGEVLPIDIGPAQRQSFGEPLRQDVHLPGPLRMRPTEPVGVRHPILRLGDASAEIWSQLPPLDGANLITRRELKPAAQVLAEADDAEQHPLLVAGQSGDGRLLAFAGDSTWRWPMAGFADAHRRFWRQSVLWLAKKDEDTDGRVWVRMASRRVMRGTRVDFEMGAESAEREPIEAAQFEVEVDTPDGRTVGVRPTSSGDTWATIFRQTQTPGDYLVRVTARENGEVLGTAEARFLVPDQDLELDRPAAEPSLMAQLADMTSPAGGAALAAEELPDLLQRLAAEPPELKQEVLARVTYWDTWPFFLLFVGLLGVEWFLRKRWGMV